MEHAQDASRLRTGEVVRVSTSVSPSAAFLTSVSGFSTARSIDELERWSTRRLARRYTAILHDRLPVKIREDGPVVTEYLLVTLGVTADGRKEVLSVRSAATDAWRAVVDDLRCRGVADVLLAVGPMEEAYRAAFVHAFDRARVLPSMAAAVEKLESRSLLRDRPAVIGCLRAALGACSDTATTKAPTQRYEEQPASLAVLTLLREQGKWFLPYAALHPAIRDVFCFDFLKSLHDKLRRRNVRVPGIFRDAASAEAAMAETFMRAANEWRMSPEKWLAAVPHLASTFGDRFGT